MSPIGVHATIEPRKKALRFSRKCLISFEFFGVADGTRTHDNRNHNPGLYQLSYSHHIFLALTPNRCTKSLTPAISCSTAKRPNSSMFFSAV